MEARKRGWGWVGGAFALPVTICFLHSHSAVGATNISQVHLSGVKEAFAEHAGAESKGIKVHFRMDESGLLILDNVNHTCFVWPLLMRIHNNNSHTQLSI